MRMLRPVSNYLSRRETLQRGECNLGFSAEEETNDILVEE